MLCLLAKVEQNQLAFDSAMPQSESKETPSKGGSITVVVQEGLQVQIPMAGMQLSSFLACCLTLVHILLQLLRGYRGASMQLIVVVLRTDLCHTNDLCRLGFAPVRL